MIIYLSLLLLQSESLGLEEALNSAFFNIRDVLNKNEGSHAGELSGKSVEAKAQSGRSVRSTSQSPASKHKDLVARCAFPVGNSPPDAAAGGDASRVAKCRISKHFPYVLRLYFLL